MVHIKKKKKNWPLSHTFLKRILRGKNNNNKRGFLREKNIIIKEDHLGKKTIIKEDSWTVFCFVKLDMQWLSGKESTCQRRRHGLDPWVGKIRWSRKRATHSSILAWKIPWSEEPGRPQSLESQTVGHSWAQARVTDCPLHRTGAMSFCSLSRENTVLEPRTKVIPANPVLNLCSLSAPSVFTCHPGHCPVSTPPALHELFPLFKLPLSAWSSSGWILVTIKNAAHVFPLKEATQAGWRACPLIPKYLLHLDTVYVHDSLGTVDGSPPGFLAMGFSRQESWSRFPFLSQAILPAPGIWPSSLGSPSWAGGFFTTSTPGKPETPLETSKA